MPNHRVWEILLFPNGANQIRTGACRSQSPVPYRLAIALKAGGNECNHTPPAFFFCSYDHYSSCRIRNKIQFCWFIDTNEK